MLYLPNTKNIYTPEFSIMWCTVVNARYIHLLGRIIVVHAPVTQTKCPWPNLRLKCISEPVQMIWEKFTLFLKIVPCIKRKKLWQRKV